MRLHSEWLDEGAGREPLVIELCQHLACESRGADEVAEHLGRRLARRGDGALKLVRSGCMGNCSSGPSMRVGGVLYSQVTLESVDKILTDLGLAGESED